jgi:hypothetical protein
VFFPICVQIEKLDIGKTMRNLSMLLGVYANSKRKRVWDPSALLEFCLTVRIWCFPPGPQSFSAAPLVSGGQGTGHSPPPVPAI